MLKEIRNYVIVMIGAACIASGFNLFLVPNHLLSGGVSGLAMLTGYFTPFNINAMYLAYNVPLLIAGWFMLGKRFIGLSILSVVSVTLLMAVIPERMVTSDTLLSAAFGGVLVGFGSGISFRVGGSSGGFDIIGSIVTRFRDYPIGQIMVAMNGLVILAMGYLDGDWNLALASMISIYITGKVLDYVYINHVKVTLYIITDHTEAMLEQLLKLPRGVTLMKTQGAFSHKEKDMLMTVTTRYELIELKEIIKAADPSAFVNIVQTVGVMGSFRRQ